MKELLYVKIEKNQEISYPIVKIGDIAELKCVDSSVIYRLNTETLYTFKNNPNCPQKEVDRKIFSILDVVEKIQEIYPTLEIQNMGETDFILEYREKKEENKLCSFIKTSLVCLICFFGSAFSIMAFNNDVNTTTLFSQFYEWMTGKESSGFTILEITYSLGLAIGIIGFFNHMGSRRFTKEPTPIEVEMRLYEEDLNTTWINNYSREKEE